VKPLSRERVGRRPPIDLETLIQDWGYLGIFLGIVSTGLGLPLPEELPIILGGILASTHPNIYWFIMLPVCIVGVVVGDGFLYGIGRLWGTRLLDTRWMKRIMPGERRQKVEENFNKYGVKILLFARLLPGIRAPIFVMAGVMRVPLPRFVFADGIYAIPGVSLLFFLAYFFTQQFKDAFESFHSFEEKLKPIIILIALGGVIAYLIYYFMRHPVTTGDPGDLPHLVEQMTSKIMRSKVEPKPDARAPSKDGQPTQPPPQIPTAREGETKP
jgi:membrane protein DedA with SNARE-associated domain